MTVFDAGATSSPLLNELGIQTADTNFHSFRSCAPLRCLVTIGDFAISALLDSGASANFMRPNIAKKLDVPLHNLSIAKTVELADDTTKNCSTYVILYGSPDLTEQSAIHLYVADMPNSRHEMIFGMHWLKQHNPTIDPTSGTLTCYEGFTLYKEGTSP